MDTNIFSVDSDQMMSDLLPPEKRSDENKSFLIGLIAGFKRIYSYFLLMMNGDSSSWWSAGTYTLGQRVKYKNDGAVYECIVASTTNIPTNSTDWLKVNKSFIGFGESTNFSSGRLSFEYAINKRFGLTYRDPVSGTSDIYVNTQTVINPPFIVIDLATTPTIGSSVTYSDHSDTYLIDAATISTSPDFILYFPVTSYTALGVDAENIVRQFVDKYCPCSLLYTIQTY